MDWVKEFFDGDYYRRDYLAVAHDTERTEKESAFLLNTLELKPTDHCLDLACGSGRHVMALAGEVAHITGYDRTAAYIDLANQTRDATGVENVEFHVADMREVSDEARFDAAWNYFTAWGYYDDETNFDVLKRIRRALKPGGRFLLETINRDMIMTIFQPHDFKRYDDGTVVLYDRRFDFATGRNHTKYTYISEKGEQSLEIDHYMPTADALVRHFRDAGFNDVLMIGAPDGGELTLTHNRMACVGYV